MADTTALVVREADTELAMSATKVANFYRCVLAKRLAHNKRLWIWCTNKNATTIQCAHRCSVARAMRRLLYAQKLARRAVIRKRIDAKRLAQLRELIHWHRSRSDDAAQKIQLWYRAVKRGDGPQTKFNFLKVVRDAQANQTVLISERERERLAGSPKGASPTSPSSGPPSPGKQVRLPAEA